ncbi:cytochrome P450 [Ilyonectria sp. MPI-CAGE-AT-0026]|nr:cytochrome P450 [Ilyonectria sp. MPI-CAGE-AT-0026]
MGVSDMEWSPAVCLLFFFGLGLFYNAFNKRTITRNGSPLRNSPGTLPIVSNGIVFLQPRENLFKWFTGCIDSYGQETLRIKVPFLPPGVIISDPTNLDYIFKQDRIFEKGKFFKERLWDLFGNGIVNVDGDLWKQQRKAGLQFFSVANMRHLANSELPTILEHAVKNLMLRADGRTVVDLEAVMHEITTQLMGKLAYGMEMHADDDFTVAFDYVSSMIARRFQNPLWFVTEFITGWKLRRSIRTMKDFGQHLVSHALAVRNSKAMDSSNTDHETSGDLIHALFDSLGDEKLVADSALNYLSAGKDTVAQALTWTFYLLMKHEEMADTLHNVIQGDVQDNATGLFLTPEHLKPNSVAYIVATFYESLRLHPPIPVEIKQAQQDTILPDGTFLGKNTIVVWCTWALNRSKKTWGNDADQYRPDRWLAGGQILQRSAADFPVFQGGSRLCLGKKMAELIAVQVIMTLITTFEISPAFEGDKVSRTHLTLPMEGGLHVYLKRRSVKDHTGLSS